MKSEGIFSESTIELHLTQHRSIQNVLLLRILAIAVLILKKYHQFYLL